MFRPRGPTQEARNWRTHFGGSVDNREEKTKQGNRERKERKKGKSSDERAARNLEEGSLERRKEREKRIRIKKRIAGGPARRGASRVLVGRETLENPGYAKHRKMALQARTLGGTRN